MTLKSGLEVTEGHSSWYHSKAWVCSCIKSARPKYILRTMIQRSYRGPTTGLQTSELKFKLQTYVSCDPYATRHNCIPTHTFTKGNVVNDKFCCYN